MPSPLRFKRLSIALTLLGASALPAYALAETPTLTPEFIYKYLVGEVAAQRGDPALAASLFYDLAQSSQNGPLAERATRMAVYAHQQTLAIRSASLWAELDPASTEAKQAMAQMLLASGNLSDAKPYLKKLLEKEDTRASGFLFLNEALAQQPDKAGVLKLIQELAQPYPQLPEARFAIAHSALSAGKPELALKESRVAAELRPGWDLPALFEGSLLERNAPEQALAYYRDFLNQYPAAKEVRLAYAKLLVNQKQLDAARQQFAQLVQESDNAELSMVVGLLAAELGDYSQADTYFQQALGRGYNDPQRIYLYLGQSAEKQNKLDAALELYRRIREGDHFLEAQLRIAGILMNRDGLAAARDSLHAIPNLSGEQQASVNQLEASFLMQAKQPQEAYDLLETTIKTLPNSPELIYDYAMAAERMRHYDVMEKQLRTLMVLKPEYAQAYNALGYSLADRGVRLDEAQKLIEKANALSPNDYFILDSLGWVYYRLGNQEKALAYLRQAYALHPDPEIAAHLGEVLWRLGKQEEARQTWESALKQFPDNQVLIDSIKKSR